MNGTNFQVELGEEGVWVEVYSREGCLFYNSNHPSETFHILLYNFTKHWYRIVFTLDVTNSNVDVRVEDINGNIICLRKDELLVNITKIKRIIIGGYAGWA